MPWCEDCAKYWAPAAMNEDGTCPTCGRLVETPNANRSPPRTSTCAQLAAGEEGEEEAKTPWHFKLLMVLLALYLTWRIIQLFT